MKYKGCNLPSTILVVAMLDPTLEKLEPDPAPALAIELKPAPAPDPDPELELDLKLKDEEEEPDEKPDWPEEEPPESELS